MCNVQLSCGEREIESESEGAKERKRACGERERERGKKERACGEIETDRGHVEREREGYG